MTALPDDFLMAMTDGMISKASAREHGLAPKRLERLVTAGLLVRVGRGVYACAQRWNEAYAWERHALRARGFAEMNPGLLLTGWPAAAVCRLPTFGKPPERVLAVRPSRSAQGSSVRGATIRRYPVPAEHRAVYRGTPMTSRAWTAAMSALHAPVPYALAVADAAARQGNSITHALTHMTQWPGARRARWVAAHADAAAESPIESLGRFGAIVGGLPLPVANAWVGPGFPKYRVDGLWPFHWAAFEADGAIKYNNREDASDIVRKQHEREWELRRAVGVDVMRFGFRAALDYAALAARLTTFLSHNPVRDEPVRWWKHDPARGPVEPEPYDWPSPEPPGIVLPPNWWRER